MSWDHPCLFLFFLQGEHLTRTVGLFVVVATTNTNNVVWGSWMDDPLDIHTVSFGVVVVGRNLPLVVECERLYSSTQV